MKIAPEINRVTLAVLIGYSPKQITRWLSDTDIPHERRGTEVLFPWPGTRVWLHKYLEDKGKRAGRPESRDDARERKEYAEAEMAELKLAEARGELDTVAHLEKALADAFTRIRAKLSSFAPRAAGAVIGAVTVQDATARLTPLVDEVFAELRQTDDIPLEEPDDDEPT